MRYILAFIIGFSIVGMTMKVRADDLPLPNPKPKPVERCLTFGEQLPSGQILYVDKRCKFGMRWVFEK